MRKGISLSIVGGVILALVGVFVMISVFTGSFGSGFENTFCRVYRSVAMVFPGGNTPPPSACETGSGIDYIGIEETTKEDLAIKVSSAVVNCWQRYNGYRTDTEVCEGWNVRSIDNGPLESSEITEVFNNNNLWQQIGGETNLELPQEIGSNSFVIIQYRYDEDDQREYIEVK